ncbi:MAG: PAS domain-containing protein [Bacteroidota bacterium]|nr:PAS domain-containing protein [Bacteroidota bacterium]
MTATNSKNKSLNTKLATFTVVPLIIFSGILMIYIHIKFKDLLLQNTKAKIHSIVFEQKSKIQKEIELTLQNASNIAEVFYASQLKQSADKLNRTQAENILKNSLENHPQYLGIYTAWEPNAFDGQDTLYAGKTNQHPNGSFVPYFYRDSQGKIGYEPLKYYLTEGKGDYYLIPKKNRSKTIIEPIKYKIGDRETFLLTAVAPIQTTDNFYGVVGIDISTEQIESNIKAQTYLEGNAQLYLYSDSYKTIAKSTNDSIVDSVQSKRVFNSKVLSELNNQEATIFETNDSYFFIDALNFNETNAKWYLVIETPKSYINSVLYFQLFMMLIFICLAVAILIYILLKAIKYYIEPLKVVVQAANTLVEGNMEISLKQSDVKEIDQLNRSFDQVVTSIKHITDVCIQISNGIFTSRAVEKNNNDQLAISVNKMIDALKAAKEDQEFREWMNIGYSKALEIIQNTDSIQNLCDQILPYLIKYINANQGKIYIANKDSESNQTILNLISTYAYNRKKFEKDNNILPGEGLVGQAYLEKDIIILTEIPDNYTKIKSGLGDANPKYIIIAPLIHNQEPIGILEVASFVIYSDKEKELIEKCVLAIGSAIANLQTNEKTKSLLEIARQQTEQMQSQEEEMRQNMEELHATQEEMQRKQRESEENQRIMESVLSNTPGAVYRSYTDANWTMVYISPKVFDILGYTPTDFTSQRVNLGEITHPDDVINVEEKVHTAIKEHEQYELFYRLKHKRGHYVQVWEIGQAVYKSNDKAEFIEGQIIDITVLKNKEQALEKTIEKLKNELNSKSN